MKKITKKMKGKKVLSLVLAAIMLATNFSVALPMLKLDAEAAELGYVVNEGGIASSGITQTRVVGVEDPANPTYAATYENYAAQYLNGASKPTDIVIPGLNIKTQDATDTDPGDYVIQGMTYYPEKDWMLVTAYHNDGGVSSKVFCLNAATGEFVALLDFYNPGGTTLNTDHGGGIAISEHNIYYSCGDQDRNIAYAPLSALDGIVDGEYRTIQLVEYLEFPELGDAFSAYVCYDNGILWLGNFFDKGYNVAGIFSIASTYKGAVNSTYNSMVFGYKLAGNSSEEEWDYLKGKFQNLLNKTSDGNIVDSFSTKVNDVVTGEGSYNWSSYKTGDVFNIYGNISVNKPNGNEYLTEVTGNFGSFNLTEGYNYTIEFTSTNNLTDMYMFAPNGKHCNVKAAGEIEKLPDGRYHYKMDFTAGLKPAGAESLWPETQSTDKSYSGTYTIRFDQDNITEANREFEITNIKITQTNTYENRQEKVYDAGSAGSPTYAIGLSNAIKDVQYAVVDNGKLYLSRSYGSGAGNSVTFGFGDSSLLTVADIDLSKPGTRDVTIAGKTIKAYEITKYEDFNMMPMSEGLCVIDGDIFITFEGASNKYLNESDGLTSIGNCDKPVDIIWQLDPYALMEQEVPEPENSIYYEKVSSLAEIENGEEYIIIHQSPEKDPVTQNNILYALNADGGLKDHKLSKGTVSDAAGYDAMLGHPITEYSIVRAGEVDSVGNETEKDRIYLANPEKDDVDSARWTLEFIKHGTQTGDQPSDRYKIRTTSSYFANCNCLYFDKTKIGMAPSNAEYLNLIGIQETNNGNGGFWLNNSESYFLWCNDGLSENYNQKITSFYIRNGATTTAYSGVDEQAGTFHCDALDFEGTFGNPSGTPQNIIGGAIETGAETFYADGVFYIYKRVIDDVASTYESRVYTDLSAELQADGTYTVDLETYAISPKHYQYVNERPTDYIIVADTSQSMYIEEEEDPIIGSTGIAPFPGGDLSISSLTLSANTDKQNDLGVIGYTFHNPEEDIYLKHTDGKYYKVYVAINNVSFGTSNTNQCYYAYYIADDGLYYCVENQALNPTGKTYVKFVEWVAAADHTTCSGFSTNRNNSSRRETVVYKGDHYRFDNTDSGYTKEHKSLDALKTVTKDLVEDIAVQNSDNRIALVQYGASNGYYNTSGNLVSSGYTDAFWSTTNKDSLIAKIDALSAGLETGSGSSMMDHVSYIMSNSGSNYKSGGDRNVAVIFLSDGVPGTETKETVGAFLGMGGHPEIKTSGNNLTTVTNVANEVISKAQSIKNSGAFIYTVLLGKNKIDGFSKKTYMDAISSKYPAATSMTSLGGQSVDGVNYTLNIATCSIDDFTNFGEIAVKETAINNAVGLDSLDANSYLRQELSNSFIIPKGTIPQVSLVKGEFDAIDRFSFTTETPNPSGITAEWTDPQNPKTFTVTGYDYAKEYIGVGKEGNKLRVRITGVLANPDVDNTNAEASIFDTTAIYKTQADMNASTTSDNDKAFKHFPSEYINIPEYTYVLDYGVNMYDSDVNGTMLAIDEGPNKQTDDNGDKIIDYSTEIPSKMIEMTNGNQDLIYKLKPTSTGDSGYVLIQRPDGTYDWFKIKVVPASNVYYEETSITLPTVDDTEKSDWISTGESTIEYQDLTADGDVYGYDSNYMNSTGFSGGTHYIATVDSSTKKSETASFTFKGTGFDLISACGDSTGIQIVKLYKNGVAEKGYIVDTYYKDANVAPMLYQVPIVSYSGEYAEYTVETTAAYLTNAGAFKNTRSAANSTSKYLMNGISQTSSAISGASLDGILADLDINLDCEDIEVVWMDDNSVLNGGTGPRGNAKRGRSTSTTTTTTSLINYIDGFRIYNPMDSDTSAYVPSEQSAQYVNVANHLTTDKDSLFAYIEGSTIASTNFAEYNANGGPKNEVYLSNANNQGLAFQVSIPSNSSKVMLGLRAVTGSPKIKINGVEADEAISSATEMYYDITEYIKQANGGSLPVNAETSTIITISNVGTGILAVNNAKFSGVEIVQDALTLENATRSLFASYGTLSEVTAKNEAINEPEEDTPTEEEQSPNVPDLFSIIIAFIEKIMSILSRFVGLA